MKNSSAALRLVTVIFLLSPLAAYCAQPAAKPAGNNELENLAKTLIAGIHGKPALKLAVLEFPYTNGKASEGPVLIQERLTTILSQNGSSLIERGLLKKVMGELNLQASGAIDGETTKKLGKLLGADAVVTGTLNDMKDERTELNARIVGAETGEILSAASTVIQKTWQDAVPPPKDPKQQTYAKKPLIQVAILLDTSNSMDGLINQARNQIWKIVTELVSSEKDGSKPSLEVALYEYGNSTLPKDKGYIRQLTPFTKDLDKVSQELFALKTNGGDEYCGWVIKNAVEQLNWNKANDIYKVIFIAGNEPFTQGPVDFNEAVVAAKAKGIFVNTIFCGGRQEGIATQWSAAATLADGDYTSIDQNAVVAEIAAPQDTEIVKLNQKLNRTYMAYGAKGKRSFALKQEMDNKTISAGGIALAASRAVAQSEAADTASDWDLVSALEAGTMKRADIKEEDLPEELKKMDQAERNKYLDSQLAERKKIRDDIAKLQQDRKKYIADQEKARAGAPNTLDKAIINSIHRQASKHGYKFK